MKARHLDDPAEHIDEALSSPPGSRELSDCRVPSHLGKVPVH